MPRRNTRAYVVSMIVYADRDATVDDVKSLIYDLTWVGGCRDPGSPAFDSLQPSKAKVSRAKVLDKT